MPDETVQEPTQETAETTPQEEAVQGPVENVKVGSAVLYVQDDSAEPGSIRPAFVTEIDKEDTSGLSRVDLYVLTGGDRDYDAATYLSKRPQWRSGVMYSATKALNSWHWPEA